MIRCGNLFAAWGSGLIPRKTSEVFRNFGSLNGQTRTLPGLGKYPNSHARFRFGRGGFLDRLGSSTHHSFLDCPAVYNSIFPFFLSAKMANCHSLSMHPDGRRFAVVAANKGSNGNGSLSRRSRCEGRWINRIQSAATGNPSTMIPLYPRNLRNKI